MVAESRNLDPDEDERSSHAAISHSFGFGGAASASHHKAAKKTYDGNTSFVFIENNQNRKISQVENLHVVSPSDGVLPGQGRSACLAAVRAHEE